MLSAKLTIEKAKKGDEQAFNSLVKDWYARIYNYVLKYFGDDDLAKDVTQKVFIVVYKKFALLKEVEKFKPWLYRIATNCCHNEHKKIKNKRWLINERQQSNSAELKLIVPDEERQSNPENMINHQEMSSIVEKALLEISKEQREVVIMKEYEGLKFAEIAEALGISENTAKSRLYYGLNALRKIFENWNIKKENLYYD